jgi:hypothetical protein
VGKYVIVVDKFVVGYEIITWCLCDNWYVQFVTKTDKEEHICIFRTNYKSTVALQCAQLRRYMPEVIDVYGIRM